jgi:hypothetical protein
MKSAIAQMTARMSEPSSWIRSTNHADAAFATYVKLLFLSIKRLFFTQKR